MPIGIGKWVTDTDNMPYRENGMSIKWNAHTRQNTQSDNSIEYICVSLFKKNKESTALTVCLNGYHMKQ